MVSANEATAIATRSPIIFMSGLSVVMPLPTCVAITYRASRSSAVIARTTSIGCPLSDSDANDGVAVGDLQGFLHIHRQRHGDLRFQRRAGGDHGAAVVLGAGGHRVAQLRFAAPVR